MSKRVLCMLSGGSDSAYAALVAKRLWPQAEFHSLFIDYGQPEARAERAASVRVHQKLDLYTHYWCAVEIDGLYRFHQRDRDNRKSVYVPLRNLVLTSIAAARAEDLKADTVVVGNKSFHKTEGEPLSYDGNRDFYKQLQDVVQEIEVGDHRIEIEPVLSYETDRKQTRMDVYYGLWKAGFDYSTTFSCWFPERLFDQMKECGRCSNCVEKEQIWNEYQKETSDETSKTHAG